MRTCFAMACFFCVGQTFRACPRNLKRGSAFFTPRCNIGALHLPAYTYFPRYFPKKSERSFFVFLGIFFTSVTTAYLRAVAHLHALLRLTMGAAFLIISFAIDTFFLSVESIISTVTGSSVECQQS